MPDTDLVSAAWLTINNNALVDQIGVGAAGDRAHALNLAKLINGKSTDELVAVSQTNPELIKEWLTELREQRQTATREVVDLASALDHIERASDLKPRRKAA